MAMVLPGPPDRANSDQEIRIANPKQDSQRRLKQNTQILLARFATGVWIEFENQVDLIGGVR